jgi:hypothetical protein
MEYIVNTQKIYPLIVRDLISKGYKTNVIDIDLAIISINTIAFMRCPQCDNMGLKSITLSKNDAQKTIAHCECGFYGEY